MNLIRARAQALATTRIKSYFPAEGPYSRDKYKKHLEFFAAGARCRERCAMAANRIGKTESMGGYETTLHLTGDYPDWWIGRRFDGPTDWWAAGKTKESARDIIQAKLFGSVTHTGAFKGVDGTGLIPKKAIGRITWRTGVPDMIESARIKHASGRWSTITLKSYEMGRGSFEGTERHGIWLDEEPPDDIYNECLIRTATTNGIVMMTFTPLDGITEVVLEFMDGIGHEPVPDHAWRYTVNAGWDDVPHLDTKAKEELLASTKPYLRAARSRGIPALGEGVIFPVPDELITCDPFQIPPHWPRICGMDFGWDHPTANTWLAYDRDNDVIYLYDEYAQSEQTPPVHASAIKGRGDWIPVAWPADGLQTEKGTGFKLAEQYIKEGVNMLHEHAQFEEGNDEQETRVSRTSVEAGLWEMLTRMQTGRWKVFKTCQKWLKEKAIYRREKGKVVKIGEDVISSSRYGMMMIRYATVQVVKNVFDRSQMRSDWRT